MHKAFWDFEIQTDYQISDRQPELVIVNKKETQPNSGLCHPGRLQSKKKVKRQISTKTLLDNLKELCNVKVTVIRNVIFAFGTLPKCLVKELENLEIIPSGSLSPCLVLKSFCAYFLHLLNM